MKRKLAASFAMFAILLASCVTVSTDEPDETSAPCPDAPPPIEPPICPLPRDACDFQVNYLEGTCWINRCIDGELSLVPKDAGSRCVWGAALGEPPWTEGKCNADGICFDINSP